MAAAIHRTASDLILDPERRGWLRGTWADTAKFHKRVGEVYRYHPRDAGRRRGLRGHRPRRATASFAISTCRAVATTCSRSRARAATMCSPAGRSAKVAAWWTSRSETGRATISNAAPATSLWAGIAHDGLPITYCYRLGCKPGFYRHAHAAPVVARLGLTAYWWAGFSGTACCGTDPNHNGHG